MYIIDYPNWNGKYNQLSKKLITQHTYDKALEAVLNNTEWPNIFDI